jgi:hypothetical protein
VLDELVANAWGFGVKTANLTDIYAVDLDTNLTDNYIDSTGNVVPDNIFNL